VQFEDDWRGVFIRGDDALLEFRPALLRFIAGAPRLTDYASVESLAALLGRAHHHVADEGCKQSGGPLTTRAPRGCV
jgi:hypothetical protein